LTGGVLRIIDLFTDTISALRVEHDPPGGTLLIQDDGVVGDDRIDGEEPGAYSLLDEKIGDLIHFHGVTSTRIPSSHRSSGIFSNSR